MSAFGNFFTLDTLRRSVFFVTFGIAVYGIVRVHIPSTTSSIKVGVLHSRTGVLAASEAPLIEATLLAIREINERGGLQGRLLEPVVGDGRSDPLTFARQAEQLITQDHVVVIFGCVTSSSRKMVKPVCEKHNTLLIYPVEYEGLEQSPNILYTGAVPNQQIIPGAIWATKKFGPHIFLTGANYVFSRTANKIIKQIVTQCGATIVGEEYIPIGSEDVGKIIQTIAASKPDAILNTINGLETNAAFFKALKQLQTQSKRFIPVISYTVIHDPTYADISSYVENHYLCWSYHESIVNNANEEFKKKIHRAYGAHKKISDPMEVAYTDVYLWAQAAESAHNFESTQILNALKHVVSNAPEGLIAMHPENQHVFKPLRIAQINKHGESIIVWDSQQSLEPKPFLDNMFIASMIQISTRQQWMTYLDTLYQSWGNKWSA